MEEEMKMVYQEYKIARDAAQLLKARVVACDAKIRQPYHPKENCGVNLQMGQRQEWSDDAVIAGYLKGNITVHSKSDRRIVVQIAAEIEGIFKMQDKTADKKAFEKSINLQLAPQLFPYLRNAVANLSVLMGIPVITLPTMDILKSIKQNRAEA